MSFNDRDLLDQVPHLRRFAVSLLRNRDQADDLVQDCLVRAIGNRQQFQAGTKLRSWLFTILHNLFVDRQRRGSGRLVARGARKVFDRARVEPEQDNRVLLRELSDAMAQLPLAQSFLLLLVTVEGFSYEEAASVVGVPVGTIRSRLSRARLALRETLKKNGRQKAIDRNGRKRQPDQRGRPEFAAGR